MSGRELRPAVLAVGRTDEAHSNPYGAKAVPVSHLHAVVLALRPFDDAHSYAHWRETFLVRRLRAKVRAERREETTRQSAFEATHEEGEQAPVRRAAEQFRTAAGSPDAAAASPPLAPASASVAAPHACASYGDE